MSNRADNRSKRKSPSFSVDPSDDIPDGGWGWIVLVASFISQALLGSICFAYGVLLPEWMDEFHTSKALISFVGATASGLISMSGPLASISIHRWGIRVTHVFGGFIVTMGFILCTIANSMAEIFLFFSIFGGVGFGLCYVPSVICLSKYFRKRRPFALGIACCGISFGAFIFSMLFEYLNQQYGWRGSMLIVGGINGNMIVAGLVLYPVHEAPNTPSVCCLQSTNADKAMATDRRYRRTSRKKSEFNSRYDNNANIINIKENDNFSGMIRTEECATTVLTVSVRRKRSFSALKAWFRLPWFRHKTSLNRRTLETNKDIMLHVDGKLDDVIEEITGRSTTSEMKENNTNATDEIQKENAPGSFLELTKYLLTKRITYAMICYNFTHFFGMMMVFGLAPSRAIYDFGFTSNQGALLVAVLSLSSLLGRFLWGMLATAKRVDVTVLFISLRLVAGVVTILSPYLRSFEFQIAFCAFVGMTFGNHSLYSLVVSNIFGDKALTTIFGYLETFNGIGGVVGPFIGGYIYDCSDSYEMSFLLAGASLILGCVPLVIREIKVKRSK